MPATLWSKPGILMIYGSSLDADKHQHNAIQLVWPVSEASCQFELGQVQGPLLINSQAQHSLTMTEGWLLLIEPNSELGQCLAKLLGRQPVVSLPQLGFAKACGLGFDDSPESLLAPLFSGLGLSLLGAQDISAITSGRVADARIQQLLTELDRCLDGVCLKPAGWRAATVASQLGLSQSRFLHLFRQQMGIAWRPYLLWRRMTCAVAAMVVGTSATDAAHLAGFSDSAHLSRTFRNQFGLSVRQAQALFKRG